MYHGVIKNLFAEKGFGFIEVEGRKKDLFFHATGLIPGLVFDSLKQGQSVTFDEIGTTEKGECALHIDLA